MKRSTKRLVGSAAIVSGSTKIDSGFADIDSLSADIHGHPLHGRSAGFFFDAYVPLFSSSFKVRNEDQLGIVVVGSDEAPRVAAVHDAEL